MYFVSFIFSLPSLLTLLARTHSPPLSVPLSLPVLFPSLYQFIFQGSLISSSPRHLLSPSPPLAMGWDDGDANATMGNVGEEGEDSPWPDDLHLSITYTTVSTTYTSTNSSPLSPSLLYNLTTYANASVSRPKLLLYFQHQTFQK